MYEDIEAPGDKSIEIELCSFHPAFIFQSLDRPVYFPG